MRRTAALIVGGGPAGSAAAIVMGRGGVRPELVERSTSEHDTVCGGFLGWDALAALDDLGIDARALGGQPIRRLRLHSETRVAEARLPHAAVGLSRRRLDEAMLALAGEAGAVVRRGRSARVGEAGPLAVRLDDGERVAADALFLATGKHELRGLARVISGGQDPPALGLRCAIPADARLAAELDEYIELHLFDGGYAGMLLQEAGVANLCLSVDQRRLAQAGGIDALLAEIAAVAPVLGNRIAAAGTPRWQTIAGVPYGWRARSTSPGLFRLGDQSAVISSLAGDGVAIALRSGMTAASAYLAHGPDGAAAWQSGFYRRAARPLRAADMLRHLGERRGSRGALVAMLAILPGIGSLAARLTRIG